MTIRILIADDHKIMRDGLRALLSGHEGMEVVAEAESGRATVELAMKVKPDIVIMDVAMRNLNGIEAVRRLAKEAPEVRVLMLSMHADKRFVASALCAGAAGYLLKDCAFDELARAIRAAASGRTFLSARVSGPMMQDYVKRMSDNGRTDAAPLTSREREVLQMLAEGRDGKEIALALGISAKTIQSHRAHIMEKLDVHNTADLVKYAIREGYTTLDK
jgi:two-component system, NarL family, response regulator NreC